MEKKNQENNKEMKKADPSAEHDSKSDKKAKSKVDKDAEELAMARVLKAFNISKEDLEDAERINASAAEMVEYDVTPSVVKINGRAMPCKGVAPRAEVEQILAAVGARRHRLFTEVLGKSTLGELIGSQFHARAVATVNVAGEKVSNG